MDIGQLFATLNPFSKKGRNYRAGFRAEAAGRRRARKSRRRRRRRRR